MRTTVQIEDDVLSAARELARLQGKSMGRVISELARKGLRPAAQADAKDGFPVFAVAGDLPLIGEETVRNALEDGD
jgi:2-phospho-L-lactate guanylyltransferase (CobY/MobA/RfbA family)